MIKFWINRAAEVFCKSKEIPTPLLYGDFDGINENILGKKFLKRNLMILCKPLLRSNKRKKKGEKKMGIPTFEELRKKGLTNPVRLVIL